MHAAVLHAAPGQPWQGEWSVIPPSLCSNKQRQQQLDELVSRGMYMTMFHCYCMLEGAACHCHVIACCSSQLLCCCVGQALNAISKLSCVFKTAAAVKAEEGRPRSTSATPACYTVSHLLVELQPSPLGWPCRHTHVHTHVLMVSCGQLNHLKGAGATVSSQAEGRSWYARMCRLLH